MTLDLAQIRRDHEGATSGEWELWTGCSWRRIGVKNSMEPVITPVIASDGHPDLEGIENLRAVVSAHNNMTEILDRLDSAEAALRIADGELEETVSGIYTPEAIRVSRLTTRRHFAKYTKGGNENNAGEKDAALSQDGRDAGTADKPTDRNSDSPALLSVAKMERLAACCEETAEAMQSEYDADNKDKGAAQSAESDREIAHALRQLVEARRLVKIERHSVAVIVALFKGVADFQDDAYSKRLAALDAFLAQFEEEI